MVTLFLFRMHLVKVLLAASLCIQGARATDLRTNQSYHDVCDTHCAVEDLSTVKPTFERQVTEKKARVVNLTISSRIYRKNADICQNVTAIKVIKSSYLIWAVSEREPYLYLPSNFLRFADVFSLHVGKRMNINMNCRRKIRIALLDEHNGTSLSDAVTRSLTQDLMRATAGTLCSPLEISNADTSYKCCQFDKSTFEIICNVVHSSEYDHWFQMLSTLWVILACLIMPLYLPAVICLFPVHPKVSESGIRCIVLGDPSPAGFGSLVVKAFVPENRASLLDKTRFFFLRVVLIPCITLGFPLILNLSNVFPDVSLFNFFGALCCTNAITCIISTFFPPVQREKCKICEHVFSEVVEHSDVVDEMKVHMFAQLSGCAIICRRFTLGYLNFFKSHVYFRLRFQSPVCALWSIFRIFYFVVHFSLAIPLLIVVLFFIFYVSLFYFCPLSSIGRQEVAFLKNSRVCASSKICSYMMTKTYFLLMVALYYCFNFFIMIICGLLLPFSIMTLIDDQDTVFPILALLFLILYYIRSCFTTFSEKYQLLKIKLYHGIQNYHLSRESDEIEDSLLLYTKSKAVAIPEVLYEAACRELRMPMMRNFSVALLQMVCLLIFVFSVFASIMTFSARSGITPLIQTVAIFLGGSFPMIFSLFSSGEGDRKLKEIDMEMRLNTFITRYAQGQIRRYRDGNGGELNDIETPNAETRYGSTSRTTTIATSTN